MRTGIFGGTFNPPHTGHVQAAKTAMQENNLDLLIIIPTGFPPHKKLAENTPDPEKRFIMTKNAFNSLHNTEISDIEINSRENNYTIDTVKKIKKKYNNPDIYLLVGTDMFTTIDSWKNSEELLNLVTPVQLNRTVIPVSSSQIREMLPKRKGREFLDDSNYSFIIKHRLYGAKPDFDWLVEKAHQMLDPLRLAHVDACRTEAVRLAERWGADKDDACEAAILHDITKKLDFSQNMCIIAEHGNSSCFYDKKEEKLLHAITGAIVAQSDFGVSDAVANAIKWHTTGRAKMSILEKIIYIADYIEATRTFPGVDILRKAAYENIDQAMIMGLEITVNDLLSRSITPNKSTYEALADLGR